MYASQGTKFDTVTSMFIFVKALFIFVKAIQCLTNHNFVYSTGKQYVLMKMLSHVQVIITDIFCTYISGQIKSSFSLPVQNSYCTVALDSEDLRKLLKGHIIQILCGILFTVGLLVGTGP